MKCDFRVLWDKINSLPIGYVPTRSFKVEEGDDYRYYYCPSSDADFEVMINIVIVGEKNNPNDKYVDFSVNVLNQIIDKEGLLKFFNDRNAEATMDSCISLYMEDKKSFSMKTGRLYWKGSEGALKDPIDKTIKEMSQCLKELLDCGFIKPQRMLNIVKPQRLLNIDKNVKVTKRQQ